MKWIECKEEVIQWLIETESCKDWIEYVKSWKDDCDPILMISNITSLKVNKLEAIAHFKENGTHSSHPVAEILEQSMTFYFAVYILGLGRNANLSDANLRNANLRNANLRNANLRNADLSDADLWNADLSDADLWNANLRNADLWNANLRNANLRNANLSDANLRNARYNDNTTLPCSINSEEKGMVKI